MIADGSLLDTFDTYFQTFPDVDLRVPECFTSFSLSIIRPNTSPFQSHWPAMFVGTKNYSTQSTDVIQVCIPRSCDTSCLCVLLRVPIYAWLRPTKNTVLSAVLA